MFDSILMQQSAVIWVMLSSVQSFLSTYLHDHQDPSYLTMRGDFKTMLLSTVAAT